MRVSNKTWKSLFKIITQFEQYEKIVDIDLLNKGMKCSPPEGIIDSENKL